MPFVANLKIRNKLILLLALPLLSLCYVAGQGILEKTGEVRDMQSLKTLSVLAVRVSALVHETQKERGATALYIGSKGTKFASELQAQFAATDKRVASLQAFLHDFDAGRYRVTFQDTLQEAMNALKRLRETRQASTTLSIAVSKAIGYYTAMNAAFLQAIAEMAEVSNNALMSTRVSAYVNFLQAKERAGIERAVLSNTFAAGTFGPGMYKKFVALVAEQQAYTHVFFSFATAAQRQVYEQTMRHPAVEETERMRTLAFAGPKDDGFGVEASYWFRKQTEKINLLKMVEDKLSEDLLATASRLQSAAQSSRWFFVAVTLAAVLTSLGFAVVITRRISRPLRVMAEAASNIAQGDVDQQIVYDARDETGIMAQAFRALVDYIKGIAHVAEALSQGDLSAEITARSENDILSRNFRRANAALRGLVEEIQALLHNAQHGELQARGNTDQFRGAYRELLCGINDVLDAVVAPINEATDVLEQVAARDLCGRMQGDYQGDFATIKQALNTAVQNLDQGLTQVAMGAEQVAAASGQISSGSQDLAQGATEQASTLEEVASSLQEMTSMSQQNAANAKEACNLADSARHSTDICTQSIHRLSQAIDEIKTAADETALIVKTIDDIAFQTNLLALNAAVEAARAGDAGKGFAVVAEEVRSLAMRSAEAAKNTARLIDEAVQKAGDGVTLNGEVLVNLEQIINQVHKVSDVMGEIAVASEQQQTSIEQLNSAMGQLNQVTQQTAANSEEAASTAEELASQAAEMQHMVATFRLSQMSDAPTAPQTTAVSPPAPSTRVLAGAGLPCDDGHLASGALEDELRFVDDTSTLRQEF